MSMHTHHCLACDDDWACSNPCGHPKVVECRSCEAGRLAAQRPLMADTMANGLDFAVSQERVRQLEEYIAKHRVEYAERCDDNRLLAKDVLRLESVVRGLEQTCLEGSGAIEEAETGRRRAEELVTGPRATAAHHAERSVEYIETIERLTARVAVLEAVVIADVQVQDTLHRQVAELQAEQARLVDVLLWAEKEAEGCSCGYGPCGCGNRCASVIYDALHDEFGKRRYGAALDGGRAP